MARSRSRRRFRSASEIREIVEAYESSGLTQAVFARSRKIPSSSLSYWIRKTRNAAQRRTEPPPLIPVRVVDSGGPRAPYEVELENNRIVRVAPGFDVDELRRLISAVESSC